MHGASDTESTLTAAHLNHNGLGEDVENRSKTSKEWQHGSIPQGGEQDRSRKIISIDLLRQARGRRAGTQTRQRIDAATMSMTKEYGRIGRTRECADGMPQVCIVCFVPLNAQLKMNLENPQITHVRRLRHYCNL